MHFPTEKKSDLKIIFIIYENDKLQVFNLVIMYFVSQNRTERMLSLLRGLETKYH